MKERVLAPIFPIKARDHPVVRLSLWYAIFLSLSLASELSFVFLEHGGEFDDGMRFARSVHGGPTCSKVAVKVYMKGRYCFSAR
jgi:hypothetical protein